MSEKERGRYYSYAQYLKEKFGEKIYKLPVSLPVSCPNRVQGKGGCSFCGGAGAGFETLSSTFSVSEQLAKNSDFIGRRYKAKKFIAYFQSFTNTYLPLPAFSKAMEEAAKFPSVIGLSISTRPDCIRREYLDILKRIEKTYHCFIIVELGLQTVNYRTLEKIHRGHSLAEYIEAVFLLRQYGFSICTHMLLNLPWDDCCDAVEGAKFLSACGTTFVKLHALYLEKGTELAEAYEKGELSLCSVEEYRKRVIAFLEYLSPEIAVERLLGRAPKENTVFSNWSMSWWKIKEDILKDMEKMNSYQGKRYTYLGGRGVNCFFE